MTAPSPPSDRPGLRAVLPTALATTGPALALVAGTAMTLVPPEVRAEYAYGAGAFAVLMGAATAVAARYRITARVLRLRLDDLSSDMGRLLQDKSRMQAEFSREMERRADEAEREKRALGEELESLRREAAGLSERARRAESERASAVSATANAAARLQALANGILADLRDMEERHTDEEVLADLLHLDHRTAQVGRVADSVAVLSGARSGRRWARPIRMESILRGAMGRIGGYRRVRVHSTSDTAVAGHAAEGVMHVLAELMDNATMFSPPTSEVHVYVEEVPAGVLISVEDSGLVMSDVQLRRAERAVSGDITGLGGLTGTRLGLAVVGRLARKHGLKVSFRPSARGGTGVLVLLPQDLLAAAEPDRPVPAGAAPGTSTAPDAASDAVPAEFQDSADGAPPQPTDVIGTHEEDAADAEPVVPATAPAAADDTGAHSVPTGLPRRRRGQTLAAAERSQAQHAQASRPARPGREGTAPSDIQSRAARFTSFRQAVRGEPVTPGPDTGPTGADIPRSTGSDIPRSTGSDLPRQSGADTPRQSAAAD
ncbi:sensor histidine kinase [Streptomyces indicus]|uniref:histidine kinase n=1 Tax=Streptomyces indicus TaxID=417292 RepID=A0A1G9GMJ5_9ACTN|nr:sensor histidine kinase [Streptomyces indicus]SDL01822.1 Signal transduction histidine kinase [Streptomyces indicus]